MRVNMQLARDKLVMLIVLGNAVTGDLVHLIFKYSSLVNVMQLGEEALILFGELLRYFGHVS